MLLTYSCPYVYWNRVISQSYSRHLNMTNSVFQPRSCMTRNSENWGHAPQCNYITLDFTMSCDRGQSQNVLVLRAHYRAKQAEGSFREPSGKVHYPAVSAGNISVMGNVQMRNVISNTSVCPTAARNILRTRVRDIGCLTSHATIFQLYMWRHIGVQADWRSSLRYGQSPTELSGADLKCSWIFHYLFFV